MSKFHNQWTDSDGNIVTSEACPGEYWWPLINQRRINGATYRPYRGDSEWVQAANKFMAAQAQRNWARQNAY